MLFSSFSSSNHQLQDPRALRDAEEIQRSRSIRRWRRRRGSEEEEAAAANRKARCVRRALKRSLLGSDQFGKTMKIDEIDEIDESDEYGKSKYG
ncbi:hypothetical protein Scep_024107 [Stephania cephalantha]|uniref:Uncharacterized protein n=1 Tax=Stephania cephalantha TaxID=152367 RepID=A0AAP0HWU3_9MAGN